MAYSCRSLEISTPLARANEIEIVLERFAYPEGDKFSFLFVFEGVSGMREV